MQIQIKEFSGPLDLLLQLIRKEEMDIFDIDIHKITEQYLNFIKENSITDLDSAGDFIKMAALLIYIKSKSLFPSESQEDAEIENEQELQKQLAQSLLKMQAVQSICEKLNRFPQLNRDTWESAENIKDLVPFPAELQKSDIKKQPILKLMRTYQKIFRKKALDPAVSIETPLPFMLDCIRSIHHRLTTGSLWNMSSLIQKDKKTISHLLVTFLALLELTRLGVVSLSQKEDFSDIAVSVKRNFNSKDLHSLQEQEIEVTL
ncbi:MAG: segregation/condensation protein A [Bdellovibrionales bacterium]|nr:segregation/condensation protein A [Bdellovibrionales bacterium]